VELPGHSQCTSYLILNPYGGGIEDWRIGRLVLSEAKGLEGWKEGRREGGKEGRREGWKDGRREGWRIGGLDGGREGGREGGMNCELLNY
jgi:hypothetical protein